MEFIENCILNQKNPDKKNEWYQKNKNNYQTRKYFEYCKNDDVLGAYVCIL